MPFFTNNSLLPPSKMPKTIDGVALPTGKVSLHAVGGLFDADKQHLSFDGQPLSFAASHY